MAINITIAIFSIGLILILGQVFNATFNKTRIPDILPLMLVGFVLGPVLKLVNPATFGQMGTVFTEIVLILVMFQTGIAFRLSYLRDSFLPGIIFTVSYIITAVIVVTGVVMYALKLPLIYSVITGFIIAENSLVIIIPLIAKLNISQNIKTILTLENTFGSIINVVVVLALLSMAAKNTIATAPVFAEIFYSFFMAALVGLVSGIFWTAVLSRIRMLENSMTLSFAFILIVYSLSAAVGSKGAIGVLMLGVVMGNIRVLQKLWSAKIGLQTQQFKGAEKDFFSEIEFAFKTLFFVYMGMSLYLNNFAMIICGLAIALLKVLVRIPSVDYLLNKNINRTDASVALAMCPNGLVSAVLAAIAAQQYGKGTAIQDMVYSVIFFTVIICSVMSWLIEKGYFNGVAAFLFPRHAQDPAKQDTPDNAAPAPQGDAQSVPAQEQKQN